MLLTSPEASLDGTKLFASQRGEGNSPVLTTTILSSSLTQATIDKIPLTKWLDSRHIFLTVVQAGKHEIKVPAVPEFLVRAFPGFPVTAFFVFSLHGVEKKL